MDKNKIAANFNRASHSYDSVANIQKQCAHLLVQRLLENYREFKPESILDLGTGTGYIPEILLPIFPKAIYSLNDLASEMLNFTQKKLKNQDNINYIIGDMEFDEFNFHELIISNFALQWANNLPQLIYKLFNNSNILAFSCLLQDNFSEWGAIFEELSLSSPLHQYPSEEDFKKEIMALHPNQYYFETQEYKLDFANLSSFINYLKNLGANIAKQEIPLSHIKQILNHYSGNFSVTYKVFFCILKK